MAMGQGREYQSICQFVVQFQKSAATNRAPAAAGRNTRTAAAELLDIFISAQRILCVGLILRRRVLGREKENWIRYA
jgi:hypothetical protein